MPVKPTPEYLRECFDYNLETGSLVWKARPYHHFSNLNAHRSWLTRFAGKSVGFVNKKGYLVTGFSGRGLYYLHRLIWAMVYGAHPEGLVDHINQNPKDNRLSNLRIATRSENAMNSKVRRTNRSGVKGVHKMKGCERWVAQVAVKGGGPAYLGSFRTLEDAAEAVKAARGARHGEFACCGSPPPPHSPTAVSPADDFEV